MADAEIRVKTVVDLKAIQNAQKEVDKIQKDLDKVKEKEDKAREGVGYDKTPAGNKRRVKDLENAQYEAKKLTEKVKKAKEALADLYSGNNDTPFADQMADATKRLMVAEEDLAKANEELETLQKVGYSTKQLEHYIEKCNEARDAVENIKREIEFLKEDNMYDMQKQLSNIDNSANDTVNNTAEGMKELSDNSEKASVTMKQLFGNKGFAGLTAILKRAGWIGIALMLLKAVTSVFTGIFTVVKNIVSGIVRTVTGALTTLTKTMISYTQQGLQNFIQYSAEYNSVMSDFVATTNMVKDGLAGAFAPIIQFAIPYLTQLVSWVNVAVEALSKFLAVIAGKNSYTKAKKGAVDLAKSLSGVSDKADEAKGSLASFDKLNVIGQKDTSNSAGSTSAKDLFEEVSLIDDDSKIVQIAKKVRELLQPVFDLVGRVKESISTWWDNINWKPLEEAWGRFKEVISPIIDNMLPTLCDGFMWFLENVLEPIGTWFLEEGLPATIDLITFAVEKMQEAWEELEPVLKRVWNEAIEPMINRIGEALSEDFIKTLDDIKIIIEAIFGTFEGRGNTVGDFLIVAIKYTEIWLTYIRMLLNWVGDLAVGIAVHLSNIIERMMNTFEQGKVLGEGLKEAFNKIISGIKKHFEGFIDFINGVFTGDMDKASKGIQKSWEGVLDFFEGFKEGLTAIFESIATTIKNVISGIKDDISSLLNTAGSMGNTAIKAYNNVADILGGVKVNYSFKTFTVPKLAQGAVIPPNNAFLAMLGDQTSGVNIETPLNTMIEAFNTALRQNGTTQGDVVVQIDGREVFRAVQKQSRLNTRITGRA